MSEKLINCIPCMQDRHNDCYHPDTCKCSVETNHNVNIVKEEKVEESVYVERQAKVKALLRESEYDTFRNEKIHDDERIDATVDRIQLYYHFVTSTKTNELYLFNGKIYSNDEAVSKIKELSEKLIPNCTEHQRNEVVSKIKAQTYRDITFDSDPNILTLNNGILNLDTLELTPHTPDNFSQVLIPVEYSRPEYDIDEDALFEGMDKNLSETLFYKSLRECFTVNGEFRPQSFESVLEMIASVFIKKQIDDKAWINLGRGNNGKSVFLEYIESLLGTDNVHNAQLQQLSDNRFASAELEGNLANIFSDLESTELKNSNMVKAITSGDSITVERKHQRPFKLTPFAKLIFSCNRFPVVYDQSEGFFRRWIINKWERDFENDSARDTKLRKKLCNNIEEKNLVFSCLMSLTKKINKNGKLTHTEDWRIIQRDWNKNADPVDDFVTNYIIDSGAQKTKRETFEFYKEWCYEHGEKPLKFKQFNERFVEYYEDDRSNQVRVWLNIDFKRPKQATLSDRTL